MSDVGALPTAARPAGAAAGGATGLGTVGLEALPAGLSRLARPAQISGIVIGAAADGRVRLRTRAGDIIVRSEGPLAEGVRITLRIEPGQPPLRAAAIIVPAGEPPPRDSGIETMPRDTEVDAMPTVMPPPAAGVSSAVAASGVATAVPLGEVGLEQLPDRLSQLSRPVVITGTVIGQTDSGATRVRTQAGEVVMRVSPPPPADAPVALKIAAGQPPATASAFLVSQPGGNPAGGPAGNPGAAAQAALPLPAGADDAAARLGQGAAAKAALAGAAAEAALPPPGTVVPGQVLSGSTASPAAQGAPPAGSQAPGPPPAPGQPAAAEAPPQTLVPGSTVAVRILGTPAGLAGTEAPQPGGGLVLTGTIAGSTNNGEPVLATPQGSLTLALRGPLPLGLKLTIEVGDPRQLVFSHPAEAAGTGDALPSRWPALAETVSTLGGLEGALVQSLLGTVVPQPNRKLAAALAFFLDAVRHGDARGWLGDEAGEEMEKTGRGDLLARLGDEFRAMARDAAQTPPGDWRPFAIPLFDGHGFQRLEFYVRAQRDDDEGGGGQGGGERSHRFLLDLDLSRFGALQLDGLVKARSRRFDLILRSRQPLPDPLRAELLGAFSASLDAVGYAGGLAFQPGARGWITPPPVTRRGRAGVVA